MNYYTLRRRKRPLNKKKALTKKSYFIFAYKTSEGKKHVIGPLEILDEMSPAAHRGPCRNNVYCSDVVFESDKDFLKC